MPEILRENGIYTHMISDHQHYWEDGGANYHHRYDSWEMVRGQEGDRWKTSVKNPEISEHLGRAWRQDFVNRSYMEREEEQPQSQVFELGFEFLNKNREEDNWFLHLECFDPHEPFFGIGGGPINLVVLYFFFSMPIQTAAQNSLYIILFSQISSLINSVITNKIPSFDLCLLVLMSVGGILGGFCGHKINKKIESKDVEYLFICLMSVIILINIFNLIKYST